jgi:6-pyruvoyltetrahydropterin/6-carboxytetrahydropterin synthase
MPGIFFAMSLKIPGVHPKKEGLALPLRKFSTRMEVFKEFTFDAAHYLPNVPPAHKCARMHGHTYKVRITLEGPLDPVLGWVQDFADIKKVWKPLEEQLDHHLLNDIPGLENPTAEWIAVWIWEKLAPALPQLHRIDVFETPSSGVSYFGK